MHSYTLQNWDGSQIETPDPPQSVGASTSGAKPINITLSTTAKVNPNGFMELYSTSLPYQRVNDRRDTEEQAAAFTCPPQRLQTDLQHEMLSLENLFDETIPTSYASPITKRAFISDAPLKMQKTTFQPKLLPRHSKPLRASPPLESPSTISYQIPHNTAQDIQQINNDSASDHVDTLSLYSIDAEGEYIDDDIEVIGIHDLITTTPTVSRTAPYGQAFPPSSQVSVSNSLFTSPPLDPTEPLFSPPPDFTNRSSRPKQFFACVVVPPLRNGLRKKDYKPLQTMDGPIRSHLSIQDALTAAKQNNGENSVHAKRWKHRPLDAPETSRHHHTSVVPKPKRKVGDSDVHVPKKRARTQSPPTSDDIQIRQSQKQSYRTDPDNRTVQQERWPSFRYDNSRDLVSLYHCPPQAVSLFDKAADIAFFLPDLFDPDFFEVCATEAKRREQKHQRPWTIAPASTDATNDDDISPGDTMPTSSQDEVEPSIHISYSGVDEIITIHDSSEDEDPIPIHSVPEKPPEKPLHPSHYLPRIDLKQKLAERASAKKHRRMEERRRPSIGNQSYSSSPVHSRNSREDGHLSLHQGRDRAHDPLPTTPSLKALGKRKATGDTLERLRTSLRIVDHALQVGGSAMDIFLHPFPPSPTHDVAGPSQAADHDSSSQLKPYRNPHASSLLLTSTVSPTQYLRGDLPDDIVSHTESDVFGDRSSYMTAPSTSSYDLGLDSYLNYSVDSGPWYTQGHQDYPFDTINPTLLQQQLFPEAGPSFDDEWNDVATGRNEKPVPDYLEQRYDQRHPSASPVLSLRYPSPSTSSSTQNRSPKPDNTLGERSPSSLLPSHTKKDLQHPSSPRPVPNRRSPSPPEVDHYPSDDSAESWRSNKPQAFKPIAKRKVKRTIRAPRRLDGDDDDGDYGLRDTSVVVVEKRNRGGWACGVEESYCHQCRCKSAKLKAACKACAKLYCNRCVAIRYPHLTFTTTFATCPACGGFCNCDVCCRKRGETFVSLKRPSRKDPGPTQIQLKRAQSARIPEPTHVVDDPAGHWAAPIYGLDGRRLEARFVDAEEARLAAPEFRGRRVFVGAIPSSWNRDPDTEIVDLEPALVEKGKGKKRRIYVGKEPPPLRHASYAASRRKALARNEVDVGGTDHGYSATNFGLSTSSPLSSLTSLTDSESEREEEQEGEGEGEAPSKSFSPDSLEDNDIARAITLSLTACGLSVETAELPGSGI